MAALFGPGRSCSDDIGRMGDDCLAIDIISPSLRQQAPLPVMVFVHGGANKQGSPKGDCAGMQTLSRLYNHFNTFERCFERI
jgi:carboxylesterase type B